MMICETPLSPRPVRWIAPGDKTVFSIGGNYAEYPYAIGLDNNDRVLGVGFTDSGSDRNAILVRFLNQDSSMVCVDSSVTSQVTSDFFHGRSENIIG